jgi:enediyne biosynthesis protein E4
MVRVWLVLFAACSVEEGSMRETETGLSTVCNDGSRWETGTAAFKDRTKLWGLEDIAPAGVRINAVDFDGDGWTDLAVRSGNEVDDFAQGVRSAWLLRNTGEGTFEDVTEASGIRAMRQGGSTSGRPGAVWVWADVDNDGDLDVYTGLPGAPVEEERSEILLNNGDGTFDLGAKSAPHRNDQDQPYGAAFTDVDLDGSVDLWTGQYSNGSTAQQDRLYLGDGQGSFQDKTKAKGLITEPWASVEDLNDGLSHTNAWSAAACDLNNDGYPELLAASYGRAANHLWLNTGGDFVNESVASGYAYDHRTDWTDNESARCWCTLHPTAEDCAGVPAPSITCNVDADAFRWNHASDREAYRLGGNSGATTCADIDNDGAIDLLTSEIVHWDVGTSSDPSEVLFNDGGTAPTFSRPGLEATGLVREHELAGWNDGDITNSVFDFDNDGWPDLYMGSSDYDGTEGTLFHQEEARLFKAVAPSKGIDQPRSHGSAVADFDRDGDLDLVVGHSTARCNDDECYDPAIIRLFENQTADAGGSNFLQLRLEGAAGTNRSAIGARVEVKANGVTQTQEVDGGHGQWGNQDDLVLHFGLGKACKAEVTVVWPNASRTTSTASLGGGYRYHLVEGGTARPY